MVAMVVVVVETVIGVVGASVIVILAMLMRPFGSSSSLPLWLGLGTR